MILYDFLKKTIKTFFVLSQNLNKIYYLKTMIFLSINGLLGIIQQILIAKIYFNFRVILKYNIYFKKFI